MLIAIWGTGLYFIPAEDKLNILISCSKQTSRYCTLTAVLFCKSGLAKHANTYIPYTVQFP